MEPLGQAPEIQSHVFSAEFLKSLKNLNHAVRGLREMGYVVTEVDTSDMSAPKVRIVSRKKQSVLPLLDATNDPAGWQASAQYRGVTLVWEEPS
ncbi:MAG: hypothetical protein LBK01_06935 [Burkholderiaceae bacterium]|nr:hypothetical protein [Burkholderiaceae bacterium]